MLPLWSVLTGVVFGQRITAPPSPEEPGETTREEEEWEERERERERAKA